MPLQLRAFRNDDQEFLFRLYASTRLQEIAAFGWPQAQQEAFLRMQFNAQKRWYEMSYSQADHQIIEQEGAPIGRLMVLRETASVHLVDIALLPGFRGQGIGGELLGKLITECDQQKLPLRLQVQRMNPAQRLYERLGFKKTSEDQMYFQMEKLPD
ncbi:MAG TPA: GNAT family N-acetyltransferase [Candidatus Angelobacter sp.]|nr:GNAT family N-acetyltransferase [Candidatus Angelobacter sp.]